MSLILSFRLPQMLIVNNDFQFISDSYKSFYSEWRIQLHYSTLRHLQRNGQVKTINKSLLNIMKKTLDKSSGQICFHSFFGLQNDATINNWRITILIGFWNEENGPSKAQYAFRSG